MVIQWVMDILSVWEKTLMKNNLVMRVASMAVASALCVGVTAATNPTPQYVVNGQGTDVVMVINGSNVYANEYASFVTSTKLNFESQFAQYGFDTTSLWEDEEMANATFQYGQDIAIQYRIIEQKFDELGFTLNKAQIDTFKKAMQDQKDQLDFFGGEGSFEAALYNQGMTETSYSNALLMSTYANIINDYYFGENGIYSPDEQTILDYYNDNYIQAKHILITTTDETGAPLDDAGLASAKALAEEALARAQSGEDFDALVLEYGEDPGMSMLPEGYIFTEGEMVTDFYEGAKALADNEISGIIESQFGYHIIMRMPLDQDELSTYSEAIRSLCMETDLTTIIEEWKEESDIVINDEALATVNIDNCMEIALSGVEIAE